MTIKKLTQSEAGKLGAIASMETQARQKAERRKNYLLNPKLCLECSSIISFEERNRINCCSQTCAGFYLNKQLEEQGKLSKTFTKICKQCKNKFRKINKSLCSTKCSQEFRRDRRFKILLADGKDKNSACKVAKEYLIFTLGNACQICKRTEWEDEKSIKHPIPLNLDHINNNPEDNSLSNLRVICPNCDRLTPGYGAKNRGNGRHARRQRYRDGKSY